MKKRFPWPIIGVLVCFILGSLSASRIGRPEKKLIDSVTIKIDSITTIKIIINAK